MQKLMWLCYFSTALFVLSFMVLILARWGEPQAAWLVCEVFNWSRCHGN